MLGYTESDLNKMINAVHDAKLFYLRTPSEFNAHYGNSSHSFQCGLHCSESIKFQYKSNYNKERYVTFCFLR